MSTNMHHPKDLYAVLVDLIPTGIPRPHVVRVLYSLVLKYSRQGQTRPKPIVRRLRLVGLVSVGLALWLRLG